MVKAHEERFGRCDVLVNNAGVGIGEVADELTAKKIDIQMNTNLRSIFLFYREALPMLRRAGEEHRNALVVNTASISGIRGEGWLSVYSATKHGVVGFTQAMNKELSAAGIKNTALCPAFVDTPMTDFVKEHVAAETMITTDGHRRGGPLPAEDLARLRHPGDPLRAARRRPRDPRLPRPRPLQTERTSR